MTITKFFFFCDVWLCFSKTLVCCHARTRQSRTYSYSAKNGIQIYNLFCARGGSGYLSYKVSVYNSIKFMSTFCQTVISGWSVQHEFQLSTNAQHHSVCALHCKIHAISAKVYFSAKKKCKAAVSAFWHQFTIQNYLDWSKWLLN